MSARRAVRLAARRAPALVCCAIAVAVLCGQARAADTPIEDRGAPAPGASFRFQFELPESWKQNYQSESTESQEQEEEDGPEAGPETGDYSQIVTLSARARCYLDLESNVIFSRYAPQIAPGVLSGTGTHLIKLSGNRLRYVESGGEGPVHWYLGSLQGANIVGLSLQRAPAALARVGDRYLIAEFGLRRRAYLQPRDVYLSPPPSRRERASCLALELRAIGDELRPILAAARAQPGRYRPGRAAPGHRLPHCVAEACPALLVTPMLQIYRTVPLWNNDDQGTDPTYLRWRASGRITRIGGQESSAPLLRVAGPYVAYPEVDANKYEGITGLTISRIDAVTGSATNHPAFTGRVEVATFPAVTDLVLAADGTLAWIVEGTPLNPRVSTVTSVPAGAPTPLLLAESEAVQPRTLSLEAGTLHWHEGPLLRESPLP